ncbi:MAG: trigger factor [Clostridiales bacterium]|jgi:trigger factor|nr:trigger factor [Clostridiales bacterium]
MTYTKTNAEGKENVFILTFDVSPEEFEKAADRAYEKTKGKYAVQGFRKGKVPKRYLEKIYGKEIFYDDALDIIMPECYGEALTAEKLDPVERPEAELVKIDDGGARFKITVTVLKPVKLGQYKGLTLKKSDIKVSDADVERVLEHELEHASRLVSVDGRPAKKGDIAVIDFSGTADGARFEGGTAEKFELELGSGAFIPGFEEQVEGMEIDGERDIKVKFPDDYHAENLRGRDAVFAVRLREIKHKEVPPLDDEFAKDVSEFDTLAAYKESVRADLQKTAEQKNADAEEKALIEKIVSASDVEAPSSFIENETESLVGQFEYRLMHQGLKIEDYFKYSGQNAEELRSSYKETAEKNVKTRLVMEELIKAENIALDTDRLEKKFGELAERAKKTVGEYKSKIGEREYDYFANEILTEQLFEFLKANNKFE